MLSLFPVMKSEGSNPRLIRELRSSVTRDSALSSLAHGFYPKAMLHVQDGGWNFNDHSQVMQESGSWGKGQERSCFSELLPHFITPFLESHYMLFLVTEFYGQTFFFPKPDGL